MSRLTADERRRANELRRVGATRRAPRVIMVEHFESHAEGRGRRARVAMLVTVAVGGAFALAQLAHTFSLYGAASFLDWLLPRL